MAKICPECGREFAPMSQSVRCPICKCVLVDNEGVDNSEQARKKRLEQLQAQRNAQSRPLTQKSSVAITQTSNRKSKKNNKKNPNTKLIIICISLGMFIGIASATIGSEEDKEKDSNIVHNTYGIPTHAPYIDVQSQSDAAYMKSPYNDSMDCDRDYQGITGVEVQNKNGVIDDFKYRIEGNTIYLIEYDGKEDCVELETSYIVDGVQYQSDISNFSAHGGYTKLIIHEGFQVVDTPIFNSSDVREVFFPRSMANIYDYTLAYMHDGDGVKNKIYYAGTQEEWLNIFTKYQRIKVEDAEFGEELGIAIGDKVNEWIGVEYNGSDFEYFFSASPDDLK